MRVVVLAVAAAMLSACSQQVAAPAAPTEAELIARGEYLVVSIGGCNDCHTPMTQQGPDMTRSLQGGDVVFAPTIPMPWAPHAPAIAGGPANYTDEQFAHFLQTGERPSGVPTLPPMPPYRFNAEDAAAVVAYIKTLPRAE